MKKNKKRDDSGFEGMERRPALAEGKKELMMAVLLRNEEAFKATRDILRHEHFSEFDRGYALAWKLTADFYNDHEALPDGEMLKAEVEAASESNPNLLNDAEYDKLSTFLQYAFDRESFDCDITVDSKSAGWAIKTTKKFLDERLTAKMREVIQSKDMIPVRLPEVISKFVAEAEQIESVTTEIDFDSFPDNWHQTASVKLFSTGTPIFDKFLGGGHAPGEVYGLMGPYGSCKTTLASMLVVEGAKAFYEEHLMDPTQPPKLAVVVCYEARKPEMRNRTLGYAAKVRRNTLESLDPEKPLELAGFSTSEKLKKYEKRLWRKDLLNGKKIKGELERIMDAMPWLRRHMVILDMTGHEHRGVGNNGVKEIAQMISNVTRQRKAKCGLAIVDYIGAMVKRYMQAHEISNDEIRHLVGGAPIALKSQIADVFDCPVWALHQLSPEANGYSPVTLADHTNASEGRNFAENLDFCFIVGKPQDPDAVALLGCTKHRRQPGRVNMVIQVDGGLNRVIPADEKFMVTGHSKKIMRVEDYNKMPETSTVRQPSNETTFD